MECESVTLPLFTVDSFTSMPFSGNPAGVCLDATHLGLSTEAMQNIAMEMNISETAFVRCTKETNSFEKGGRFQLKWFTPTKEVPLCGHGTLAAAAVLFYCMGNARDELIFDTLSGSLTAERKGQFISLDLPLNPPEPLKNLEHFTPLLKLVLPGMTDRIKDVQYSEQTRKLLLRLHDQTTRLELEGLQPPIDQFMSTHPHGDLSGVIVTVRGDPSTGAVSHTGRPYDFISRYFAPWNGIPEDPVTGAAHTVLAGYWSRELGGKCTMFARQCSARGGDVELTMKDGGRLGVAGPATVVFRGNITISNSNGHLDR